MDRTVERAIKELEGEVARGEVFLGDGSARDFPEYKEMVGKIAGIKGAIRIIKELQGQQKEEDF